MGAKYYSSFLSPVGILRIEADEEAVTGLFIVATKENLPNRENAVIRQARVELSEYFAGVRRQFDIPVKMQGTEFQKSVWRELQKIPYGETRTYGEIAEAIGNPKACRAVGGANNKNRILILIPCHRVIGADGGLVGFGCGLPVKEKLLALERRKEREHETV